MNLNESTKNISENCISIPVMYNSGRKGYITTSNAGTYICIDGSTFIDLNDGYLHIDHDKLMSMYVNKENVSLSKVCEIISKMNTFYFAGILKVNSNLFTLEYRKVIVGLKSPKEIIKDLFYYKNEIFNFFQNNKKHFWNYRIDFKNFTIYKYEIIEIKKEMICPPFGANWQKYYSENEKDTWLIEAEKLKGNKIYLA